MFGLMRAKKCGLSAEEKKFRRLNYCGTCKTIGSLYGQKSRFLLNYDTVFLAEILTSLSDKSVENWQTAYQSYNCLSLPKEAMPDSLTFAATTNLILTEFKLADHISDDGKRLHKIANRAFSRQFRTAEEILNSWSFPLERVKNILSEQEKIEANKSAQNIEFYAEPTAKTTAIFFAEGVKLVGRSDLKKDAFEIGYEFGKLIYLLDAFEDYEKDFRSGNFNALREAFGLSEDEVNSQTRRKVVSIFNELESEIIEKLNELPISESKKSIFSSRLSDNLQRKLKVNLPVVKNKTCSPKPKQTFAERWGKSVETAKVLAGKYYWQMPFVFIFVLAFALIAPAQTKEAKSAKECFDLSFNLMFLGGIFGSVLASTKPIFSGSDPDRIYPDIPTKQQQQQNLQNSEESLV